MVDPIHSTAIEKCTKYSGYESFLSDSESMLQLTCINPSGHPRSSVSDGDIFNAKRSSVASKPFSPATSSKRPTVKPSNII